MRPRATILIPVLRQKDEWLDQAVRSAVEQTVVCEVIVIIADETPRSNCDLLDDLAARHENLRVPARPLPRGFPHALNFGIRAASTERVGFLLSDDWLEKDCVAECLPQGTDIVSASHATFHEDGVTPVEDSTRILSMKEFVACPTLESRAAYLSHFLLFQKAALERVGYLDESIGNFPGIDDYDLIWAMLEQDATVSIVEKCLYNMRDHPYERLTLANPGEAVRNLEKILYKHQVAEPEFSRLIQHHANWYGRPIAAVLSEMRRKASETSTG